MTEIIHEPNNSRFVVKGNEQEAVIEYQLNGNQIDFTRTFVPESLRGEGLAGKLVRNALLWAKENQFDVTSSCWYVQKFL